LVVFALLYCGTAHAATYYVDPAGDDHQNDGLSLSAPFQTIGKAASVAAPGDTCYIRGGTYRETVAVAASGTAALPITFQAYGNEVVTISGADVVTNWSLENTDIPNIYYAPMSSTLGDGNQVFQGGVMKPQARWPNAAATYPWENSTLAHPAPYDQVGSYSYADTAGYTGTANGWLTDAQLPSRPDGYWNGATVHILSGNGWIMAHPKVINYTDSTRKLVTDDPNGGNTAYKITAGNEYYLTGKKGELDSAGEWFYEPTPGCPTCPGRLYFYSTTTPANVEVKQRPYGFDLSGRAYIHLVNLGFFACTIQTDSSSANCILDGLSMRYLAHNGRNAANYGLTLRNGFVLRNSQLSYDSQGLVTLSGSDIRMINNDLHDSGYVPTWTALLDGQRGVDRNLISHNSLHDAGRACIGTVGRAAIVQFNDIYAGMRLTSDGALYYTFYSAGNTLVRFNKIHDASGPVGHSGVGVIGFYLDSKSSNWVVHHNIIWNLPGYALLLNASHNFNAVFNNTCWNAPGGSILTTFNQDGETGTHIYNNIFNGPPKGNMATWNWTDLRYNLYTNPLFVSPGTGNFQLQAGSDAIDRGTIIPGITDGYVGPAPDRGALESGATDWTGQVGFKLTPPSPDPVYSFPTMVFANQVKDGSFEKGAFSPNWTVSPGAAATVLNGNSWTDSRLRSDNSTAQFNPGVSEISQVVGGLLPDRQYRLYCPVSTADAGNVVKVGVRNYGYAALERTVPTTGAWNMNTLTFITGPANTSAEIYVNVTIPAGSTTHVYVDDLGVMRTQPAVLHTDPTIQYAFDQSSGTTATDSSVHGFDGTIYGAATPAWQAGRIGNALGFDGVDDYVLTPPVAISNAVTVACWAKSATATWNEYGCLMAQRPCFVLHPNQGSKTIRFMIYTGPTTAVSATWTPPGAFDITQWHHYAGVFSPSDQQATLYVDGLAVSSVGATAINASTEAVFIGKDDYSGRFFNGAIDDARVYDSALSGSEIARLASPDADLKLHLALDESSGNKAWDASSSGANGTLYNFATPAWNAGVVNGCLAFDGISNYLQTAPITTPAALTVACWARSNTATWNAYGCLVSQRPSFVLHPEQGTRNMRFIVYSGPSTAVNMTWVAPAAFDITQWHHYVAVFNPATDKMELFVDGVLSASLTTTVTMNPDTGGVFIGKDDYPGRYFNGKIDDVRIYSRALTATEVLELADQVTVEPYF
jgi:hypothetical protein